MSDEELREAAVQMGALFSDSQVKSYAVDPESRNWSPQEWDDYCKARKEEVEMTKPDTTGEFAEVLHDSMIEGAANPDSKTPWMDSERQRENRIEALRAASRIVAGLYAGRGLFSQVSKELAEGPRSAEHTIATAEIYARWLEAGKYG